MRKFLTDSFNVEYSFYIYAAVFLLLVPLRLALAWILAVAVHELSHFLALKACQVTIYNVRVRGLGIVINTAQMTKKQELICSLAGPFGGLCMLAFAHFLPCTAICAFVQSLYNLLPILPLDGGRALGCILCKIFGDARGRKISAAIGYAIILILAVLGIYLAWWLKMGLLPIGAVCILCLKTFSRNISCKPREQIVQ